MRQLQTAVSEFAYIVTVHEFRIAKVALVSLLERCALPNELVDVRFPKPVTDVMRTAFIDTGEHVIVAGRVAIRVDVDHRAVDLEQCDHFFNMGVDDESVRFPGRFIDVATFPCHPVMLEVAPLAFQDKTVHR